MRNGNSQCLNLVCVRVCVCVCVCVGVGCMSVHAGEMCRSKTERMIMKKLTLLLVWLWAEGLNRGSLPRIMVALL